MTYDELLDTIGHWNWVEPEPLLKALRAIVELHKPESSRMPFCVECRGVWQGEIDVVLYPCPTVKAIEKELS
jgi:hypothetical protein